MARTTHSLGALLRAAEAGRRPVSADALELLADAPLAQLLPVAESLTLAEIGRASCRERVCELV